MIYLNDNYAFVITALYSNMHIKTFQEQELFAQKIHHNRSSGSIGHLSSPISRTLNSLLCHEIRIGHWLHSNMAVCCLVLTQEIT